MKTYIPKIDSSNRKWHLVDLNGVVLGRTGCKVANILRGKDKPIFICYYTTMGYGVDLMEEGSNPASKNFHPAAASKTSMLRRSLSLRQAQDGA